MITRFDSKTTWVSSRENYRIEDMDTSHLYNLYVMFAKHPSRTLSMLLYDFDHQHLYSSSSVWQPNNSTETEALKDSVHVATSMSENALIEYAYNSPLGKAIAEELRDRGVNIDAVLSNLGFEELKGEE